MLLNKKISILYFVRQVFSQILLIIAFTLVMGFLDKMSVFKHISIPLSAVGILGTVVSLLLAFRTSQSYERWWEARIVWGAIVNDSRTLIRQLLQFIPDDQKVKVDIIAQRQIVWNYALAESLRRLPFSERVRNYLDQYSITAVNIPNALLDMHSEDIKRLVAMQLISERQQIQVNETIMRLCDNMGKCERIKNTVFPRSYSVLVHILIYVFTITLPFALDDAQLAVEIILTILIPVIFLSIEKTAILMQDPFENSPVDTPMTALAYTIETNIRQMIGSKEMPEPVLIEGYYQM